MKEEQQRIIVYGDSVILAGVRASLSIASHLEIIPLDQLPANLAEYLSDLKPTAVIFDLGRCFPEFPLALLQQAGLLLIGIDPETHQTLVWSGRQAAAVAAADLIEILHN